MRLQHLCSPFLPSLLLLGCAPDQDSEAHSTGDSGPTTTIGSSSSGTDGSSGSTSSATSSSGGTGGSTMGSGSTSITTTSGGSTGGPPDGVDEDGPGIYPSVPRIIAFGDVHGDLGATRGVLEGAGVIDGDGNWIAGTTWVVQTGDQLDRGYDEEEILELFESLRIQAAEAGGRFLALNGNHELMNVEGDMRYVFDQEAFGGLDARIAAFAPGGEWALNLAKRNTVIKIGDNVFVHGGVLPKWADDGIEGINEDVKTWLRGLGAQPGATDASDGIVWDRTYSDGTPGASECALLDEALAILGAKRMIVAHTVQNYVNPACDGKVWRIDTGMAAYYGGSLEALEIEGEVLNVITVD